MPTVLRIDGFDIRVRTRDHTPPHVHVFRSGYEVVINLGDEFEPPYIRDDRGMPVRNMRQALEIVTQNRIFLTIEWAKVHE